MKIRIITAVVGIILALGLVALGGWFLTAAIFLVSLASLLEYENMMTHAGISIYRKLASAALALVIGITGFYSIPMFTAMLILAFMILLSSVLFIKKEDMHRLIYTCFSVFYFGIGFGSLSLLRGGEEFLNYGSISVNPGIFLILFVLIGTWASDSFAFFAGRRWGKYKMAPHISPNKTVEGLLGGMAGTVLLCLLLSAVTGFSLWKGFFMAILVAVAAPIGDLFESYIKRACRIKDSGHILPGHGGMMDRFDSLLFAAPVVVMYLIIFG